MDLASQIATILGVPIATLAVPAVNSGLQNLSKNSKIKKWAVRIDTVALAVVSKQDYLSDDEMNEFVELFDL